MSKEKKLTNQAHTVYDNERSFFWSEKRQRRRQKLPPNHFNHSYTFVSGDSVE